MRIAWVLYGGLEQRTGGTIYDAMVVEGLRREGDEVEVVSLDANANANANELARVIEGLAPDVVVGDELCFPELAEAFPRMTCTRVLLVHHLSAWEVERSDAERAALRREEARAIEACDRVIATSETTRTRLVREGARGGIDVVLPGADRLAGCESGGGGGSGGGSERVEVVFVGAIVPRKRVVELVKAFGGAHASARLVLVGSVTRDRAYVADVENEIRACGVGERVTMTGELDEDGVARAIRGAAVLVMPSSLEGYGIAATEAIHAGVPVIASRAEGLEEALASCPAARMFADDEDALAAALDRFLGEPDLRAAMSAAARDASPRMPTWSECVTGFRRALGAACAAGRSRF